MDAAPARSKARAQASMVAPEVSTSSTKTGSSDCRELHRVAADCIHPNNISHFN
jgi:hypothetical protein